MNNSSLRDAQKVMLDILVEFDRICQKYELTYWLDFGTALGAIRHQGFIPWDDDLDVSMLKEDYDRFLQIAPKELSSDFFLQTKQSDPCAVNFFAKIRHRGSTFIDSWELKRDICYHQGIYIDIFPAMKVTKKTLDSFIFRALILFSKLTHNRYIRIDFLTKIAIDIINSYSDSNGDYLISSGETMHKLKPIEVDEFFPLQKVAFEGKYFPVPKNAKKYLAIMFGDDFMQLPPEDKRKVHSVYIDINTPCKVEQKNE